MKASIAVLPGDGIGPQVTREAVRVLRAIARRFGHELTFIEKPIGGAALRQHGTALPRETLRACLASDAVFLGAVGSPDFTAEAALLELRRALGGFANLRPSVCRESILGCSPLRADIVRGVDLLIVRELLGGLYFGEPRGEGLNTMRYSAAEVERVARVAFEAARKRRKRVTSVDKANVLETSRLWRDVVTRVARDYPDVTLDHLYVDACAMLLVSDPRRFDVILTENLFGDILSDEAAAIGGSLGLLASATVGGEVDLYEPVHGSAPDLAEQNVANPLGAIASTALLLRYACRLEAEANAVEDAIEQVLANGIRTRDLGGQATTSEVGEAICAHIAPRTLLDKIWEAHIVCEPEDTPPLLYIDLHLLHEVTSPQAFEGLRTAGRTVRRPDLTVATVDHNVATGRRQTIDDPLSALQIETLRVNCRQAGITMYDIDSPEQGIVHVIGPDLGLTQPGMTIVCGDSHTSTHGAFGALAFGIGTSEVEHVLATQCLSPTKPRAMNVRVRGTLADGITAKDLALAIIRQVGTAGGVGYAIEYSGETIEALSMEGRMTLCNMSIEAGARAGIVAPDETTFTWLADRGVPCRPQWRALRSDPGVCFDAVVEIDATTIAPLVTWGTSPDMVAAIDERVPAASTAAHERALAYMGLQSGTPIDQIPIDRVFIGSCTNARLEDLRAAARVVRGYRVSNHVRAMVVPGSQRVKRDAEREGLDRLFVDAGFEWRNSGCSMCLGMNADILGAGERCASTSNRNFEGRQGKGGRTHLVSPAMAAAAAIAGRFTDIRQWRFIS